MNLQNQSGKRKTADRLIDHARLSKAVQKCVEACSLDGGDGYRECMTYAVGACIWFQHHFPDHGYRVDGGYLACTFGKNQVLFEHYWLTNGPVIFDYAAKHNVRLVQDGLKKNRGPFELSDEDVKRMHREFYIGPGDPEPWLYVVEPELAKIAVAECRESMKVRGLIIDIIDRNY